jgi:hypothetical protein
VRDEGLELNFQPQLAATRRNWRNEEGWIRSVEARLVSGRLSKLAQWPFFTLTSFDAALTGLDAAFTPKVSGQAAFDAV